MRRRGFTLVELLVVSAIIALLLGLLLPSLSRAREDGRRSVCLNNLHQIMIAVYGYGQENSDRVVPSHCTYADTWLDLLKPYSRSDLLYRCPSDRSPYFDQDVPGALPGVRRLTSYGTNSYVEHNYPLLTMVRNPAAVIYVAELNSDLQLITPESDHFHPELWFNLDDIRSSVAGDRHNRQANYAFLDGHVATLRAEQTWRSRMDNDWDPKVAR